MQTVVTQGSTSELDKIQPVRYDGRGRQAYQYLPYVQGQDGKYRSDPLPELNSFYQSSSAQQNDGRAVITHPYTRTIYEESALNRIKEVRGPGDWHTKPSRQVYATSSEDPVLRWTIRQQLPEPGKKYDADMLYKDVSYDEDNHLTVTYTDKLGQVILSQTVLEDDTQLSTYRVYDRRGRLRFVIPPEALEQHRAVERGNLSREEWVDAWVFRYQYDQRGLLKQKGVPGAEPEYMIYDQRDRLILSQSGQQRELSPKEWTFYDYDRLNRLKRTGIYQDDGPYQQVKNRDFVATGAIPANNNSRIKMNQRNYYDDYDQLGDYAYRSGRGVERYPNARGLVTGTRTRVLGTNQWLYQANYYNDRGQLVQTVSDNYVGGLEVITYRSRFDGLPTSQEIEHTSSADYGSEHLFVTTFYRYNTVDQLTKLDQQIERVQNGSRTTESNRLLAEYNYNSLGQLIEKNLHQESGGFLQSIDYRYNEQGWLERINDAALGVNSGNPDSSVPADLFGMQLHYQDAVPALGNQNLSYNGNISAVSWRQSSNEAMSSYQYNYDNANRLTDALYQQRLPSSGSWNLSNSSYQTRNITYDGNGNILGLERYGDSNQAIDMLSYKYNRRNGNRLLQVADASGNDAGFAERSTNNYQYDNSGNLTRNLDKQINRIRYNHFNLPERINLTEDRRIEYHYDAAGNKLAHIITHPDGQQERTTYSGGLIYQQDKGESASQLNFITHPEGRTKATPGSTWVQQYEIKDHLGNTRVTFNASQTTTTFTASLETGRNDSIAFQEEAIFDNLAATRTTQAYHNTTAASNSEPNPNKVARLNPAEGTLVGPRSYPTGLPGR